MRPVNSVELEYAIRWFMTILSRQDRAIITRAMRSFDRIGLDGNHVLVYAYRADFKTRIMGIGME